MDDSVATRLGHQTYLLKLFEAIIIMKRLEML